MNSKELISLIATKGATDMAAMISAVQAFEESTINDFIAPQFGGEKTNFIEVDVPVEVREKLFQRIQGQWEKVGEREPYASVLSHEKFKQENIAKNLVEFRDSGTDGIRQLTRLAQKNGVTINFNQCLELGCGVGRMTAHLAKHFKSIIGLDISPGNIMVCEDYLRELKIPNAEIRLLKKLDDLDSLSNFDVFISFIVIQHNPPPIQKYILEKMLSKLNEGGVFLFQTIVHHPTYSYTAASNFNYAEQDFEMHCLPMREIFRVIRNCNLTLLDVIKDRWGGYGVDSNTFFGINSERIK